MKKLYTLSLCLFALLVLVACGENWYGSGSGGGSDVKSLRLDAENAFRDGKYETSFNICKKITEIDPTSSFGYYGMARAGLWQYGINPLNIFGIIKTKEDECPFMSEDIKTRNNYLQAMRKVFNSLTELDRRDSLTALWEFHEHGRKDRNWDSTFIIIIEVNSDKVNKEVDLDERLSDFRRIFCGGSSGNACSDTTSKRKPFPLSDREYTSSYFGGILLLSSFSQWFLNLFDTNNDGCITRSPGTDRRPGIDYPSNASEWKKWGCKGSDKYDPPVLFKNEGGKCVPDNSKILEDLQDDMNDYYKCVDTCRDKCDTKCQDKIDGLGIGDINNKIDEFGDDFGDIENILNSMGIEGSEIEQYKANASFYKMGAHRDVDGDGCIDEELIDGLDNDGDGFINENSRISPTEKGDPYRGISPMNNSMYGSNLYKDDSNWEYNQPEYFNLNDPIERERLIPICNDPNYINCHIPEPNEYNWVTVLNFTQKKYPDGRRYWTSNNATLKLQVAQDKNCKTYKLPERIKLIGGCWPWYSQQQFDYYCNLKE